MSNGLNGLVYTNVPPMPNTKMLASSFPTAAPTRTVPNRADAMFVVDMEGCISLSHNSSTSSPTFTLLTWSDICGYWIIPQAAQTCTQYGQIQWPVFANTPIYIYASASLAGAGAIVAIGGVTIQGNSPVPFAGE